MSKYTFIDCGSHIEANIELDGGPVGLYLRNIAIIYTDGLGDDPEIMIHNPLSMNDTVQLIMEFLKWRSNT